MIRWHYRLNGHEFEQTLGDSEGQGSLVCCSPLGRRESDVTEGLNNNSMPSLPLRILFVLFKIQSLVSSSISVLLKILSFITDILLHH